MNSIFIIDNIIFRNIVATDYNYYTSILELKIDTDR